MCHLELHDVVEIEIPQALASCSTFFATARDAQVLLDTGEQAKAWYSFTETWLSEARGQPIPDPTSGEGSDFWWLC